MGIDVFLGILIILVILYIAIYPIIWIYNDANKRGKSGTFWGVATIFFYLITLIIYLIVRPRGELVKCQYCGKVKLETLPQCPHCKSTVSYRATDEFIPEPDSEIKKAYEEITEEKHDVTPERKEKDIPTHTLIVEVKNIFNKEPLTKATVLLWKDGEKQERTSDIDGKVIFGKVKEGAYSLNVSSRGFDEITQEVKINKSDRLSIELKGKATLSINVLDAVNHEGIADAIIQFGNIKAKTFEKGLAVVEDISFGKYDVTATKDSYITESKTYEVTEIQQNINILLSPDIELEEEYRVQSEMLRNSLDESLKKLSSACDMCIPDYYKNICHELIRLNETIASTPVYIYADQSSDKINTLYRITGQIIKEMESILTNSENINEFITLANTGFKTKSPKININPSDYHDTINSYMSDANDFSQKYKAQILNKLQEIDKQITNNLQTFNINPIANLWSISQKIITNAKNESDEAASLLLANILLDCTKKMFFSQEISRILKKKIL